MLNLWEIRKNLSNYVRNHVLHAHKEIRNFASDFCKRSVLFRFDASIKLTAAFLILLFLIRICCFLRVRQTSLILTIST